MSVLTIVLIVIAGIIVLVLVAALFAKKDYAVERQIIIDRPVPEVYDYMAHLKNQDNFSKWVMRDPQMRKEYTGTDATVGFTYTWDSKKGAGQGSQTIIALVPDERIDIEITFIKPFAAIAPTYFETMQATTGTLLKWGLSSKMPYPMNVMTLFVDMGNMLGKDMDESLSRVKQILETTK